MYIGAVSYTHLSEEAALLHRYIDSLEEPQHTVIVMRDIGGYSFEAVSYTHLDVYKRQWLSFAEKQHIGFYALRIENTCRQAQNSMQIEILQ